MIAKKSVIRLSVIIYLILAIGLFSNCSKKDIVGKLIDQTIVEFNKQCPMPIDTETRLDSMSRPAKNIMAYNYSLPNIAKEEIKMRGIDFSIIEKQAPQAIKLIPSFEPLRKLDVIFRYTYYDKNGVLVHSFDVTPEQYSE